MLLLFQTEQGGRGRGRLGHTQKCYLLAYKWDLYTSFTRIPFLWCSKYPFSNWFLPQGSKEERKRKKGRKKGEERAEGGEFALTRRGRVRCSWSRCRCQTRSRCRWWSDGNSWGTDRGGGPGNGSSRPAPDGQSASWAVAGLLLPSSTAPCATLSGKESHQTSGQLVAISP